MADHKPLYRWSLQDAVTHNEVQDWRDSYRENCDCARAIERAIADHYHDNILENGTKDIIDRYGFDRVNWVLANTLQEKAHDGRFSQENKRWAKGFFIPRDDVRWHFCVESHPGLTDLFINQTREAWQKLGLFETQSCISEKDGEIDYTKNYTEQGGDVTHIGGKLIIDEGGSIEGLPVAENQTESTASTVATLKEDFNALLEKLKDAGLMAPDEESNGGTPDPENDPNPGE